MKSRAALVLPADRKAVDAELAKLKGTWKAVSYEDNGRKLDEHTIKDMPSITFNGRKFRWSDGVKGTIAAIDPTKKPKTLDYKEAGKDGKERTELAIYELDGDTFRDCTAPAGQERPKELTAKKGTGYTMVTYKRVK